MKNILIFFLLSLPIFGNCQNYKLVWEENFNGSSLDSSIWNVEEKEGVWNTGQNNELQFYTTENVTVGNDGEGNNCLIIKTVKEAINGYSFSSGRINTNSKMSFTFGKLEARIKIPDLKNGLWPAFWTVGYGSVGWPANGEIDIMEMGHDDGIALDSVNSYLSSATHWESGDNRADHNGHILASEDLSKDYHLYSVIWTPEYIRTYLDDSILVYDFSLSGGDKEEYTDFPNLIIFNTAVGGVLPGITNPRNITAPLPAEMFVDYVKLYQIEGEENFLVGPHIIEGKFGVFAEVEPRYSLNNEFDAEVKPSGLVEYSAQPYGGYKTLSYDIQSSFAFDVTINSLTTKNMSRYANGGLIFYIKTNYPDNLNIKITDIDGNISSLTIDDSDNFNPDRNGTWEMVNIPLSEFVGTADLSKLTTLLSISGEANSEATFIEIDEIYWEEEFSGAPVTGQYFGIYNEHNSITNHFEIDDIYVWNGFSNADTEPFFGENILSYTENINTWNGFGIHGNPVDISSYVDGNLILYLKTNSQESFRLGMKNIDDYGWEINFEPGNEPITINKNGSWNELIVPISNFQPQDGSPELSADLLKETTIPFFFVGTVDVAIDEIYLSKDGTKINYNSSVSSPRNTTPEVIIYPNPTNDCIYISGIKNSSMVSIYSMDGRVVENINYKANTKLEFSKYVRGTYLLEIKNDNTNRVYKVVKK